MNSDQIAMLRWRADEWERRAADTTFVVRARKYDERAFMLREIATCMEDTK